MAISSALWLFGLAAAAQAGDLQMHVLDVGQGDSILLETPAGRHILVDAGPNNKGVAETLSRLGVEDLELAISTHAHADHIGGMSTVLMQFDVKQYLDSGVPHTTQTYKNLMTTIKRLDVNHKTASAGTVFEFDDGVRIRVIWPGARLTGTRSDLNSNSVVLRIEHGEDCMLLTGDAEAATESILVRHNLATCQVLKVPHHGSRHSSTAPFLAKVQPEIAVISAGMGNRYSHPRKETLSRLEEAGATIYRTDQTGLITIVSTGHGLRVVDGLPSDAPLKATVPPPETTLADSELVDSDTAMESQSTDTGSGDVAASGRAGWLRRLLNRLTTR